MAAASSRAAGGGCVWCAGCSRELQARRRVVVAARRAKKTLLLRTIGVATVARFLTRARRAVAFRRGQWWSDMVVATAECGGCGVGWCGRERKRDKGYGLC